MSDNYYNNMGIFLRDALTSDEDPFKAAFKDKGHYRKMGGRIERRPPPHIPKNDSSFENKKIKRAPVPDDLIEDFAILQVLPGVPLDECKKAWKCLIKKYHPDFESNVLNHEKANTLIYKINNSYKRIEFWFKTGKILQDKN